MFMKYYAGGLITPGYYYRVSTRVYQITEKDNSIEYTNVTAANSGTVAGADGTTDLHANSEAVKWDNWDYSKDQSSIRKAVFLYTEGDALTATFALYDVNDTSVDGKYFVRLAEQQTDGTWTVLDDEGDDGVKCDGLDGGYTGALLMDQVYTNVRFTGLKSETTYRLQFYAIMDIDFDNQVETSTGMTTDSPNILTDKAMENDNDPYSILKITAYYQNIRTNNHTDMESRLTDIYKALYGNDKPYEKNVDIKLANSNLLVAYSSGMKTQSSDLTSYAGKFSTFSVKSAQQISVNYTGSYNTSDIAKIDYDITYTSTDRQTTKYYVQGSMLNSMSDGYYFSSLSGKGTLTFNFITQEEQSSEESTDVSSLDFTKNKGDYTITLRFYSLDSTDGSYTLIYKTDWTPTIS
jgi:hypothetical protein